MSRRRKIVFAIITVLLSVLCSVIVLGAAVIFGGAWLMSGLGEMNETCSPDNPSNVVESIAHFTFPPSAKNLESSCFGLQGWTASATFEMQPNDMDTFLSSTYISELGANSGTPQNPAIQLFTEQDTGYLFGSRWVSNEYYQEIFIDTTNSEWYRVYIYVLGG